ncbi:MAG TPA: hypothetical protein PKJ37_10695 [Acidobacteriota bacterium]|nr:hypothetical protein [Acidobacteriota bacterium]HNT18343.1 hypothetical protein [Acidobacteriota bacterium]
MKRTFIKNTAALLFLMTMSTLLPKATVPDTPDDKIWRWVSTYHEDALNFWFPMSPECRGESAVVFRFRSSGSLVEEEYWFCIWRNNVNYSYKAALRTCRGGSLYKLLEDAHRAHPELEADLIIRGLPVKGTTLTEVQCPKLSLYFKRLSKMKFPLGEPKDWIIIDPPYYDFQYTGYASSHYESHDSTCAQVRQAIKIYQQMQQYGDAN